MAILTDDIVDELNEATEKSNKNNKEKIMTKEKILQRAEEKILKNNVIATVLQVSLKGILKDVNSNNIFKKYSDAGLAA